MKMMICALGLLLFASGNALGSGWKYEDQDHWATMCKMGHLQSPIPLSESIAEKKEFTSFIMENYDQHSMAIMKNNGHSAEIRLHIQSPPEVKGGGLPEIYVLDHLHFHWQSEHTIDGYRFPLELHLVHYAKAYGNLTEALKHRHGAAVFAVLFDLSPDDDEEFQPLLEIIEVLKDRIGEPRQITNINVKNFLPRDKAGYYRYEGSLTTPGCTEGIVWTVFTNTIRISENQVRVFEQMRTEDQTVLKHNYRSLQPINSRPVYLRVSPIRGSATAISAQSSIMVLASTALIFFLIRC